MKTIKTSFNQNGISLYLKALIVGTIVGLLLIMLMLCLVTSLLLVSGTLPKEYLEWIMMGISAIACYFSGFTTARITKVNGMISGLLSGLIIMIIIFVGGLVFTTSGITYISIVKSILFMISGAIGGIKGVNKKEKLKI